MTFRFDENAYYNAREVRAHTGLSIRAINNEVRCGRLRTVSIGETKFYKGSWILAWLDPTTKAAPAPIPSSDTEQRV